MTLEAANAGDLVTYRYLTTCMINLAQGFYHVNGVVAPVRALPSSSWIVILSKAKNLRLEFCTMPESEILRFAQNDFNWRSMIIVRRYKALFDKGSERKILKMAAVAPQML